MKINTFAALSAVLLFATLARAGASDKRLDIYWNDTEGGAATLIVTPAGESVLIDTGNRALRQRVERQAERRREERRRVLSAAGVDHLELETGADYKLPLRRHFAMRARRVGRR